MNFSVLMLRSGAAASPTRWYTNTTAARLSSGNVTGGFDACAAATGHRRHAAKTRDKDRAKLFIYAVIRAFVGVTIAINRCLE